MFACCEANDFPHAACVHGCMHKAKRMLLASRVPARNILAAAWTIYMRSDGAPCALTDKKHERGGEETTKKRTLSHHTDAQRDDDLYVHVVELANICMCMWSS